jgi:DinB superfamily
MGRKAVWSVVAVAVMLSLPGAVSAQVESLQDFQVADAGDMGDKFAGLAESFSDAQMDWRPMEGVRSVKEVLALAVAEANLFPAMWGATPPSGIGEGFGGEMGRVTAMSRTAVIAELNKAFEYLGGALSEMGDDARMADGNTFGRSMKNSAGIAMAMADMHEHLGQLIAYARANEVVPPWSMGN